MQGLNFQGEKILVPDRHGAISWKHWIFCPTDHLDFENLENRRRYHNPGKPRTAGLCGREVVASDHLPLSSTFFGRPKPPDLTHKTAAVVPILMLFSFWRYSYEMSLSTSVHTGPTRLAASSATSDAALSTKASHSPSQAATLAEFVPELQHLKNVSLPVSGALYLVYSGADFRPVDKVDPPGQPW